ncbi:MAG: VWA domain-containing protein, partial [Planctomycetales bacterium]|nr:VWA domain-containing protein [Planctomycetales bacterium]
MSRIRRGIRIAWLSTLSVGALLASSNVLVPAAGAATPDTGAAKLDRFVDGDGEGYFALSIAPDIDAPATTGQDVVIAVDTSASQTGGHRQRALEVVESLLLALGPQDRVQILAVDVDANPLTDSFVPATSPQAAEAIEQLYARTPLGSTDMATVLESIAGLVDKSSPRPHSAVYIGDGVTLGNLFAGDKGESAVDAVIDAKVPVSSFAVGPQKNDVLLAAIANRSGGMLVVDDVDSPSDTVAAHLAQIATAPVVWPSDAHWPASFNAIYPAAMPPLRFDRDTVVIGTTTGTADDAGEVTAQADVAGRSLELAWHVESTEPSEDNAYLKQLVAMADDDEGRSLPTLGTEGLLATRALMNTESRRLTELGRQAAAMGDTKSASRMAERATQLDPGNTTAIILAQATVGKRTAEDMPVPRDPAPATPRVDDSTSLTPENADLIDEVESQRRVRAASVEADVRSTLNDVRKIMRDEPTLAIDQLKILDERLRRETDLEEGLRRRLHSRIETALREASRHAVIQERDELLRQEAAANDREAQLIRDELVLNQERAKSLAARFNSLLDEHKFEQADQVAGELAALNVTHEGFAPQEFARIMGFSFEAQRITREKRRRFIESIFAIERSHIPFPDDVVIVYPDADWWREMSERRKAWATVDLAAKSEAEKKIYAALESPTTFDFTEEELQRAAEYLHDLHDIPIILDRRALEEAGLGTDLPITASFDGVTLKSALKLMLRDSDLTYVVQDDVLMITTAEAAEGILVNRVYPVADLVVPVNSGQFGGGIGGGGFGGGGLGGGGFGGGGGGLGGGGFGGGGGGLGGGGGGGFFNIPPGVLPQAVRDRFKAFMVEDDAPLSLTSTTKSTASKTSAPASRERAAVARPAASQPSPSAANDEAS